MDESSTGVQPVLSTPILVWESGDLSVFHSVGDLVRALEPVDVENGIYVAYDRLGRLLRLQAKNVKRGTFMIDQSHASIVVEPAESEPTHADDLKRILIGYIRAAGQTGGDLESMELQRLVDIAGRSTPARARGIYGGT